MSTDSANSWLTRRSLLLRLKEDGPSREVAWTEFYNRYAVMISSLARRLGMDSYHSEEVVQQVMMGFFAAAPRFVYNPQIGRFRGYLKTCAWRVIQERFGNLSAFGGRHVELISENEPAVEQMWSDVWEAERLHQALESVRNEFEQRGDAAATYEAFSRYVLLDRPAHEVAAELEMSVDSVYQAKVRVTKALRRTMKSLDSTGD